MKDPVSKSAALVAVATVIGAALRGRELPMPIDKEPRYLGAWLFHAALVHTPRILFAIGLLLRLKRL